MVVDVIVAVVRLLGGRPMITLIWTGGGKGGGGFRGDHYM